MLLAAIHMAAWIKYYSFDWILRWAEKDRRSHLPGLLAFITILVVVGPAVMRHRNWRVFRFTHYGVVIVYFFAILHFPPLAFGVTPALLLHLAATAVTRYRETRDYRQSIEAAYYDEAAGIVSIDILRSAPVRPGKYFVLRLPELNSGEMHPFSVAKMFPIGSNADPALAQWRTAMLSTADDDGFTDPLLTRPPLSGQLTSDVAGGVGQAPGAGAAGAVAASGGDNNKGGADAQQEDWVVLRLMVKVSMDKNSWTARLAAYLKTKQIAQRNLGTEMVPVPFSSFRINGPYGRLEVNPAVYCQFVFVAGGVGINPLLYALQCMSLGMIEYTGDPLGYLSVSVYWLVRDEATYESYIQDLLQCKMRLAKLCPSALLNIRVIMTSPACKLQQLQQQRQSPNRQHPPQPQPQPPREPGAHVRAVLDASSAAALAENITTERLGKRPDFMDLAKDALRRCRAAAADPRHIIAAEDTTPEREALLRESVAVLVCGPPAMASAAVLGFRTAEKAGGGAAALDEVQPLTLHIEEFQYRI